MNRFVKLGAQVVESVVSVAGIRTVEEPHFIGRPLTDDVEVREYGSRIAAETTVTGADGVETTVTATEDTETTEADAEAEDETGAGAEQTTSAAATTSPMSRMYSTMWSWRSSVTMVNDVGVPRR